MLRLIGDGLRFLYWLAVLQLARLAVVLFCIAEVVMIFALWVVAFIYWQQRSNGYYLLMPIGMMVLVIVQVSLWQFMWLQLAQRGGKWRVLAEWFSEAVRVPVVRPPHPWE